MGLFILYSKPLLLKIKMHIHNVVGNFPFYLLLKTQGEYYNIYLLFCVDNKIKYFEFISDSGIHCSVYGICFE